MLARILRKNWIVSCIVLASLTQPAVAGMFSQTQTDNERRRPGGGNKTDSFRFTFSGLAPVAPSASGFKLDLTFRRLDLDTPERGERLRVIVNPGPNQFLAGRFETVLTSGYNTYDYDGYGKTLNISFADIGGRSFFADPFQITLAPDPEVESRYDVTGWATLKLSYESASVVPEPNALLLFSLGAIGLCHVRLRALAHSLRGHSSTKSE